LNFPFGATLCLRIKSPDYPPSAIDGVSGPGILIRRIDAHWVATACLIDLRRSGAFDAKAGSMIVDHPGFGVSDDTHAKAFYSAPLGVALVPLWPPTKTPTAKLSITEGPRFGRGDVNYKRRSK
jgi:hypothetical protein